MKLPEQKCVKRLQALSKFDKRSFRYIPQPKGGALLIACPKGKFAPKGRKMTRTGKFITGACKVGTRAVERIEPAKGGRCRVGYKRR